MNRLARLALIGYGKMGKLLEQLAPGHGFEVALRLASADNPGGAGITPEGFRGIDVAIDFSTAAAVPANAERIAALGGLQKFTGWNGPMLTDSGGFQVMSLADLRKVN